MSKKDKETKAEFISILKELSRTRPLWEVWSDFVFASAIALSNALNFRQDREDEYLKISKKYSKEELTKLCELLGCTALALAENSEQDFLGQLYMELDLGSHWHGQFFTPYHIAELMAKMTVLESEDSNGSVQDSCCGSGVMLIAAANIRKHANGDQQESIYIGQDIDSVAGLMAYIQLSLLGLPGYIKIGDSLTDPICDTDSLDSYWFTSSYLSLLKEKTDSINNTNCA